MTSPTVAEVFAITATESVVQTAAAAVCVGVVAGRLGGSVPAVAKGWFGLGSCFAAGSEHLFVELAAAAAGFALY